MNISGPDGQEAMQKQNAAMRAALGAMDKRLGALAMSRKGDVDLLLTIAAIQQDLRALLLPVAELVGIQGEGNV